MRVLAEATILLLLCAFPAQAQDGPETIAGRDRASWFLEARAHEREIERLEASLAGCEEREAPPIYRTGDADRYHEVVRCDDLRAELEAAREAQDAFEDLARRLGVPPGWLR